MGLAPRIENIENGTTGPLSFRNKIINGSFDIWQRGTSQTSSGYGSDDRWRNDHTGSTKTHSQQLFTVGQTEVPGNPRYFSRTVVTSAAGSGNQVNKYQYIEGVRNLAGQTATLSFWAKADANKNMAIEFVQSFGTGGSPSATIVSIGVTTCALTTSWKKFTVTVSIPSISGKTLGSNNDDSLALVFWFDAGSTYNSRTNSLGQQSGTFDIAQVQLEAGSTATAFEQRSPIVETSLCKRYFHTIVFDSVRNSVNVVGSGIQDSSTAGNAFLGMFPAEMRAVPEIALTGTWVGYGATGAGTVAGLGTVSINQNRCTKTTGCLYVNYSGGYAGGSLVLYSQTAGSTINFSAEL